MIKFKNYPPRSGDDVEFSSGTTLIIESLSPDTDYEGERKRLFRVGEAIGLILHANTENPDRSTIDSMAAALTFHWERDDFDMAFFEGVDRAISIAGQGVTTVRFRNFPPRSPEDLEWGDGTSVDYLTQRGVLDSVDGAGYSTAEAMGRLLYANLGDPGDDAGDIIRQMGQDLATRWEGEPLPAGFHDQLDWGLQNEYADAVGGVFPEEGVRLI